MEASSRPEPPAPPATQPVLDETRERSRGLAEPQVVCRQRQRQANVSDELGLDVAVLTWPTAVVPKPVLGFAVGSMVRGLKKKLATR